MDHANIISIDVHNNVRPDSKIILRAAMEVVQEEGFNEVLQGVRDRVDQIESLHRTRELMFKDLGEVRTLSCSELCTSGSYLLNTGRSYST